MLKASKSASVMRVLHRVIVKLCSAVRVPKARKPATVILSHPNMFKLCSEGKALLNVYNPASVICLQLDISKLCSAVKVFKASKPASVILSHPRTFKLRSLVKVLKSSKPVSVIL